MHARQAHTHRETTTDAMASTGLATATLLAWCVMGCASMDGAESTVRSGSEEQYLADRDNGWLKRLYDSQELPTAAVLPPGHSMLTVTANEAVDLKSLVEFMDGRDVTKAVIATLGAPAIVCAEANGDVRLHWPRQAVDHATQTTFDLDLVIGRMADGGLHVVRKLLPSGESIPLSDR